jgi:hypothetical protein
MYTISIHKKHMVVKFEDNFGYEAIRAILHHQTRMPEYIRMHDIWLIGKHHSLISLGELLSIVDDFTCLCPTSVERKKIALVVDQGLTESIVQLLAQGVNRKHRFECRVINTLYEAEAWLGVAAAEAPFSNPAAAGRSALP